MRTHLVIGSFVLALTTLLSSCGGDQAEPTVSDGIASDGNRDGAVETKAIAQPSQSKWSAVIGLPLVPASVANLPNGKLLLWSAESRFSFGGGSHTYSALFDPQTNSSELQRISETGHNMFCVGTSNLPDGRLLINGGLSNKKTSLYNALTGSWSVGSQMNIPRGYQANTVLQDGRVLTLGGSWGSGSAAKDGEIWSQADGWRKLTGVPIGPFLSDERSRSSFGPDSHFWLLPAGNGKVFHAGPGTNMHWIDTNGNGAVQLVGPRGDDEFSINGSTVMYEQGRILKTGGAHNYTDTDAQANRNSFIIDITGAAQTRRIASTSYPRAYHNSVVLPTGEVVLIGGQTYARGFSDTNSVLVPELFDPVSETFSSLPAMTVPRNYHSVAILLPDARVLSAGGGLCGAGCAANHADAQILSPYYLFNANGTAATRPVITSAASTIEYGTRSDITTDSAVTSFSMVRLSSTTHAINNDQRRIALSHTVLGGNRYSVQVPKNPGWAIPGYYMMFAIDSRGVPSVSKIIRLSADASPKLTTIDSTSLMAGFSFNHQVLASHPSASPLSYSATGLPAGLHIDSQTGLISGVPTSGGQFAVTVDVTDGTRTISTEFRVSVTDPGSVRFVRLEQLTEVQGRPWATLAELDVLDLQGNPLPFDRSAINGSGWHVSADSAQSGNAAALALDGDASTIWSTQFNPVSPPQPHWIRIDMQSPHPVGGIRVLPRQDSNSNGMFANYRVLVSSDGVNWSEPVSSGKMNELASGRNARVIPFWNVSQGRSASQSSTYQAGIASIGVDGNLAGTYGTGAVTHTNNAPQEWWQVDLGQVVDIRSVRVWNRSDCCSSRLSNFTVFASETAIDGRSHADLLADSNVSHASFSGAANRSELLTLVGRGRFVRVQLTGADFLSLSEVQVFGEPRRNRAPVISAISAQQLTRGLNAQLSVLASDADGDTLTYSANHLPSGLSIDADTGLISGTPSAVGQWQSSVHVDDNAGASAQTQIDWTIVDVDTVIQAIPTAQASANGTVSYTVDASGAGDLQYQWDFGDDSTVGDFSSDPSVNHRYNRPGVYTITLTVRSGNGSNTIKRFLQVITRPLASGSPSSSSDVLFETRDGTADRVWVTNSDHDSVAVFDAESMNRIAEIAVGKNPRAIALSPSGSIWVSNRADDSISIIDPTGLVVVQTRTLPQGSQPMGLVFGPAGNAYLTLSGSGKVAKLNPSGDVQSTLSIAGFARHLGINAAGTQLWVSHFITPPQPGESTRNVQTTAAGIEQGGLITPIDLGAFTARPDVVLRHSSLADNTVQGSGVPNYLVAPVFSPDGLSAWVPSKQDNISRGTARSGEQLNFQNTVRAIASRIDLATASEDTSARVDFDNSGLASAATFSPRGAYLFVSLQSSRQIAVADAEGRRELFRFDTGFAPEGLLVSPDGKRLFVHSFTAHELWVYDLEPLLKFGDMRVPRLAQKSTTSSNAVANNVLRGKQIFYDARDTRLALDGYLSCAVCHADAGTDGRTWDMTGFGEGLRNTPSLVGRIAGHGRLHWTANFDEIQDFEGQIRAFSAGSGLLTDAQFEATRDPLGSPKAGLSDELDALAAYLLAQNRIGSSPLRSSGAQLSANGLAGQRLFASSNCASCHSGTAFTDSESRALHDIGTIDDDTGQRAGQTITGLDTPGLRGLWLTGPYLHDGSAQTVQLAVRAHNSASIGFDVDSLSDTQIDQLATYLLQIDDNETSAGVLDTDGDGLPDATDPDDDNDGVVDGDDAFPLDASETIDTDNDGTGNNADTDDDNDGVDDANDAFPLDAGESIDTDNDGTGNNADTDDDNDGVVDGLDAFPLDASESIDTDNDGIGNHADSDDDNDGVLDVDDLDPLDPNVGAGATCNLISDGGFETGTEAWSSNTDLSRVSSAHGGSAAAQFGGGWISRTLAVSANTLYTYKGFYQNTGNDGWTGYGIDFIDETGAEVAEVVRTLDAAAAFSAFSLQAQIPADAVSVRVWFYADSGRTLTIDDVDLRKTGCTVGGGNVNQAPFISSPGDQLNQLGDSVNLPIQASDPEDDNLRFTSDGLPAGLSIHSATGVITGTLNQTGVHNAKVLVSDAEHQSELNFIWTVTDPDTGANCNLLTNGGFENGIGAWSSSAAPTITSDAHTGNSALQFANGWVSITVAAQANASYALSGQFTSSSGTDWAGFGIDYLDAAGNEIAEQVRALDTGAHYALLHLIATTPSNTHSVRLWFYAGADRSIKLDDMDFRQTACAGTGGASCNRAVNGDFESGLSNWASNANPSTVDDAARGSKVASLSGGWMSTAFAVVPGAHYTASALLNASGSDGWTGTGVDFLDAAGVKVGDTVQTIAPTTQYELSSLSVTAPATANTALFWFFADPGRQMLIDDVDWREVGCQ